MAERPRRPAAGRAAVLLALFLAGCAASSPPPACPDVQLRRASCASGLKLMTYDPALDLAQYCEGVGEIARRAGADARTDPPVSLTDGTRVIQAGLSGWLVFPAAKDLTDAPAQLRDWMRLRNCVPPPPR